MGCYYSIYASKKLKRADNYVDFFSLEGKEFIAKIVDVYDGDTCNAVIMLDRMITKFKIRCNGYDSPEMKPGKNIKNREKIIENANKSKNYLFSRVTNVYIAVDQIYKKQDINVMMKQNTKLVKLKCYKWDKYGRLLADIYVDDININTEMINQNYGIKYEGGTKPIHIST